MSIDLVTRQVAPQEPPRQPVRAAGPDRVAGAAPPAPSPEVGPPNPRLRMDRDLGMVVIEFRDASGRISNSLPSERELRAYRASINYGADLPMFLSPISNAAVYFLPSKPTEQRPMSMSFALAAQNNFAKEGLKLSA